MKNYFLFVLCLIGTLFTSCENGTSSPQEETLNTISAKGGEPERAVILSISWDEWGRTSKNCKGMGLCNATVCWFCCFDANGNRVPCSSNDSNATKKSYTAKIDSNTKLGELYIPMSHDTDEEITAISDKAIFYVDKDIVQPEFKIHSGEYIFDRTIGDFGGYKVVV